MFKLPKLQNSTSLSRLETVSFDGLNRRESANGRHFFACSGMTSSEYPFISSRKRRNLYKAPHGKKLLGLGFSKKLYFVLNDGEKSYFYYDGQLKGYWDDSNGAEKHFAEVGKKICILPDFVYFKPRDEELIELYKAKHPEVDGKVYTTLAIPAGSTNNNYPSLNTNALEYGDAWKNTDNENDIVVLKKGDFIRIWAKKTENGEPTEFCGIPLYENIEMESDTEFKNMYFYATEFLSKYGMDYEMENPPYRDDLFARIYMQYVYPSEYEEEFVVYNNSYIAWNVSQRDGLDRFILNFPDDEGESSNLFKQYFDGKLSVGSSISFFQNGKKTDAIIQDFGIEQFVNSNNTFYAPYIAFTQGDIDWVGKHIETNPNDSTRYTLEENCYFEILKPALSNVCSCNNRLWGYFGNTIYASALGQPFSFTDFSGNAADSYNVDLNIGRKITSCSSYAGYPVFFTEDRIIKIYGNTPASFSVSETICPGISSQACNSISYCGGILYFLCADGNFVSFSGTFPSIISLPLNLSFDSCVSCSDSRFVYFFTHNNLFIFDTLFNCWMCEEGKTALFTCSYDTDIIFANENTIESTSDIGQFLPEFSSFIEPPLKTFVEFPITDDGYMGRKSLHSLFLKLKASKDTFISVSIKENDQGVWQKVHTLHAQGGSDVYNIPLSGGRSLSFAVKIDAIGDWQLEGYSKQIRTGSFKK